MEQEERNNMARSMWCCSRTIINPIHEIRGLNTLMTHRTSQPWV